MGSKPGLTREEVEQRVGFGPGFTSLIRPGRGGLVWLLLGITLLALLLTGGLPSRGRSVNVARALEAFPASPPAEGRPLASRGRPDRFVAVVVADLQQTWAGLFRQVGLEYRPAMHVVVRQEKTSDCGSVSRLTGPIYCRFDRTLYLELPFFRDLRQRFGRSGDFAQAYVVAHLFGHHVQNVLGIVDQVRRAGQESPPQAPELQLRLELQADCLAGAWAHSAYQPQLLDRRRVEEGLAAASAVAAVRILSESAGPMDREAWGSAGVDRSARWFRRGFDSGKASACNIFGTGMKDSVLAQP